MDEAEGSCENDGTPGPAGPGDDPVVPMERGAGQESHPEKPLDNPGGRKPPRAEERKAESD